MSVEAPLSRVAILVPPGDAAPTRALLLELAPGGFEECVTQDGVELAAYGDEGLAARVVAAFPAARVTPVAPGWENAWRAFHRPVVVGGIWIGPPWEVAPVGMPSVTIDPGQAFGTGAHATTRLCVELLAMLRPAGLLDIGCGSGVLALAAARLGFAPLVGVDDDPVAIEAATANAAANGIALTAFVCDARRDPLPSAPVAVVNILLPAVEAVLPRLSVETAVTSGYLAHEQPSVPGWRPAERRTLDGWAADVFVRA